MGAGQGDDNAHEGIPADLIREALEHIVASSAFDASRRNRDFLRFVVEETLAGRGDRIKAYTIGTCVLQRGEAFDPQADPIVRIEASRLRRSLERYYLIAGRDDPIHIDLPKWGYVPSFRRSGPGASAEQVAVPAPQQAEQPVHQGRPLSRTRRAGGLDRLTSRIAAARGPWMVAALAAVAIVIATGAWIWQAAPEPGAVVAKTADRGPSIIVLPFENLSDDAGKAYLAGGITEEILAGLAQFKELFVYARDTSAHYGAATSYQELHRDLGVRYVLDGSVREAAGRIRVTARLVNATTGVQLWASAYEGSGSGADLFRAQTDIAQRVAIEIAQPYGIVAAADLQHLQRTAPGSMTAYQCVLQVLDYYRHMTKARVEHACTCLERAVEEDPAYADAWALLSMSYLDHVRLRMVPTAQDQEWLDRALGAAQRAAEADPNAALAQRSLLMVHAFRGEVEEALAAGERALALSPNNAEILAELGKRLALMGEWERGVALIHEAIAHNPVHPGWYHTALALNFYRQGLYVEALGEAKQIDAPGWVHNHTVLAMIYGQLGWEEAQAAAHRLLELDPDFEEHAWHELQLRNFPEAMVEHMIDGLRKAGLRISEPPHPLEVRAAND